MQDRFLWLPPLEVRCACGCGAQRWFGAPVLSRKNARTKVPRQRDLAGEAKDEPGQRQTLRVWKTWSVPCLPLFAFLNRIAAYQASPR
jgi:hypothetical protein